MELETKIRDSLESLNLDIWTPEALAKFLAGVLDDWSREKDDFIAVSKELIDQLKARIRDLENGLRHESMARAEAERWMRPLRNEAPPLHEPFRENPKDIRKYFQRNI